MKDLIEKFWVTEEGYPAVVRFNSIGYRLGYVGVPKTHKLFKINYDNLDIDCHGGLTYSNKQITSKNVTSYPTKDEQYNDY